MEPGDALPGNTVDRLADPARAAPLHFWIIAVLSLLWNSFGCYDYTMTKLDPDAYLAAAGMSAEAKTYLLGLPGWVTACWALGVWGSLAGSVLLLVRSRRAVAAFTLSLVGLAVSQGYQWLGGMPAEMATPEMWVMSAMIWAALLFFLFYARFKVRRGVLR